MTEGTRAVLQNTRIHQNETVFVWSSLNGTSTPYFGAWTTVSDGAMRLFPVHTPHRYYPSDGSALDFLALHGRFRFAENAARPDTVWHTVAYDQRAVPASLRPDTAYLTSDMLRSTKYGAVSPDTVRLLFHHMLSRIQVCLQAVGSVTDADLVGASLHIVGVKPTGKMATATGVVYAEGADTTVRMDARTIPSSAPDFSSATYGGAVVPPQVVTGSILRVGLADGKRYYALTGSGGMLLESGKMYTYNLSMRHLIMIVPVVEEWGEGEYERRWAIMVFDPVVEDWVPAVIVKYIGQMEFFPVVEEWQGVALDAGDPYMEFYPVVEDWTAEDILKYIGHMEFWPVVDDWECADILKRIASMEFTPVVDDWLADEIAKRFTDALKFLPVVEEWQESLIGKYVGEMEFRPVVEEWDAVEIPLGNGSMYTPAVEAWDSLRVVKEME